MNNIVLLTVRDGSSLKDKSFIKINNKECIKYILDELKKTSKINDFYCSSDSKRILKICQENDYKLIERPKYLSNESALHIDVIKHSLEIIKSQNKKYIDTLTVVLGNAPIIYSNWIEESIKWIKKNPSYSSVIPVYEYMDHSPFRSKLINKENGLLEKPDFISSDESIPTNRQMLPKTYFICHNFWTLNIKSWINEEVPNGQKPWSFMGNKIKPLIVPKSHDIHSYDDAIVCENIINWYDKNPKYKKASLK